MPLPTANTTARRTSSTSRVTPLKDDLGVHKIQAPFRQGSLTLGRIEGDTHDVIVDTKTIRNKPQEAMELGCFGYRTIGINDQVSVVNQPLHEAFHPDIVNLFDTE